MKVGTSGLVASGVAEDSKIEVEVSALWTSVVGAVVEVSVVGVSTIVSEFVVVVRLSVEEKHS